MSKLQKKQQLAKICNCCFLFSSKTSAPNTIRLLPGLMILATAIIFDVLTAGDKKLKSLLDVNALTSYVAAALPVVTSAKVNMHPPCILPYALLSSSLTSSSHSEYPLYILVILAPIKTAKLFFAILL